ncbi:MAG: 23S rRNA (adenine(2503)-C(2))-methyltransferase RlmN, partial [Oscillospiraceae bacterium]|nr:23S rRNA (adenine(2503)-C(2))-methyltransferase RlmN [Oscillospiraceae bacterium]
MVELLGLLPEDIAALLPGAPAYRSSQVFRWLHRGVRSFAEMGNLPLTLRAELASLGVLTLPSRAVVQTAPDGTTKTLWRFEDGQGAESVLMTHRYGKSLCLSTQVGCRQGCVFCASAIGGLVRNLTAAEMLSMVIFTPSTP